MISSTRMILMRKTKWILTTKYLCLIILFSFIMWINLVPNVKEIDTFYDRENAGKFYLNRNPFLVNYSHAESKRNESKIARSGRLFQSFKRSNVSKFDSKDYHLLHRHNQAPIHKIFQSFGQDFGSQINEPDFKKMHDFQLYLKPRYLKSFKNPCFLKNVTFGAHNASREIERLQCVPFFMIVGFPKCGTTDLWSKLKQHPQVSWLHAKEINFFNKKQYDYMTVDNAVDFYQRSISASTEQIKKCVPEKMNDLNPCITGDASVDTIFDNKFWRQLPGNDIKLEPVLTNADYVHKVNPDMKIIVLVREPVERLYSDYIYMSSFIGYVPSPEDFHITVVYRIRNFTSCRQHHNLRACAYDVYDDWNLQTYKVRLNVGLFSIFLDDWLKVFPRHNVLVVKSEDTRGRNERSTFKKILQFLGLIMPTRKYISEMNSERTYNNQRNADSKPMLTKTELMLHEFYKAFNTFKFSCHIYSIKGGLQS